VIFDLDGVLVDTEIWWDEERAAFARRHGRDWTLDDRTSVMGANSRQWSATMVERLGIDMPAGSVEREIVDAMVRRWQTDASPLIPGARPAVERLAREFPLAVASSAHCEVIEAALEQTALRSFFGVIVYSDEVAHGKPEPDVYLEAARQLGVDPVDILVIEDSLNGVRSGRAAGMTVVLVPNASIPPAPGAAEAASVVVPEIAAIDPAAISAALAPA